MDNYAALFGKKLAGGGGSGTSNYNELTNKPAVNGTTLTGDKSLAQLGIQPEIEDLTTIRSGASAGTTAVQPATMETALAGKQDTIADLSDIRTGAGKGATAVQTISINGAAQTKTDGNVDLPAYPTTLPASDTTDTYSASGTAPVSGKAVKAALETLDVASVGGSGKVITTISETDGKISATAVTMDTTPTASSAVPVTSGGVAASQAEQDAEIAWNANHGYKNLFLYGDLSNITSNFSDQPLSLPSGDYVLRFETSATSGTFAVRIKDGNGNSLFYTTGENAAGVKTLDVSLENDGASITFYSSASTNFTNIMIQPAFIKDRSFVPYVPTMQEMYQATKTTVNIGNNADLNNFTQQGVYNAWSVAQAASTQNSPVTDSSFLLEVFAIGSFTMQRISRGAALAGDMFVRYKSSSGWQPWFKFTGTQV